MGKNDLLIFENSSGELVYLSSPDITKWFEVKGRTGFTAPLIENITQKYANGVTKVIKRLLKPRDVTVSMVVLGDNEAERDSVFFNMIDKLMDVTGDTNGRLYVRRSDGKIVYLNCVYSSGLSVYEQYRTLQKFTLEFYASDPWFYADLDDVYIEAAKGNYLTLSDTLLVGDYHKLGEFISSGSGEIVNTSNDIIQPVIRLQKVFGTLSIVNQATGDSITLNDMSMGAGQTLVIDTRDDTKNIYIESSNGSTRQAGQYLEWNNTGYEFPIVPGKNTISFDGGVGSVIEKLTFSMSQKFLSA